MTLLLILLGLALIVGIARYNNDDSLFWKLAVSFVGAFMAAEVATNIINSDQQSNDDLTQVCPTQGFISAPQVCAIFAEPESGLLVKTHVGTSQKPVSQDLPAISKINFAEKYVCAVARGQPSLYFDDS